MRNKKVKGLIIILFVGIGLMFCTKSNAATANVGGVEYEYENYSDGVKITWMGSTGGATSISIPSTINGKKVIKMENTSNNVISSPSLNSLILPDTLIELGANSIVDCDNLSNIYIPYSVYNLSDNFISNCNKLNTIYVDENVESIRSGEKQANVIKNITGITPTVKKYTSNDYTYSRFEYEKGNHMEAKIYKYNGSSEQLNIPDTLGNLPVRELNGVFSGNENITSINGGKNLVEIQEKEFFNCKNLETVDLSNSSIYIIGNNAFTRCYELETIKIGKNVTSIGSYAFEIVDTIGNTDEPADKDHNTLDGGSLKNVIITGTDIVINQGAFQRDANLEKVQIIGNSATIGNYAFRDCTKLNEVDIRGNVYIGNSAFKSCVELETTNFGKVTGIESNAFDNCISLVNADFAKDATIIGHYAFRACVNLNSVQFGDNLTSIGAAAFAYCKNFPSEITIPKNVESIGMVPFLGGQNLSKINVDEENEHFVSIDGVLVEGTKIKVYPEGKDDVTIYNIPSEITDVEVGAFANNQLTKFKSQNTTNGLVTVDGAIYKTNDSEMKLIAYPGNAKNAILNSNTTSVESYALYGIKAHIIRIPGADDEGMQKWGGVHWIGNLKDENPIIYYYGQLSNKDLKISEVNLEDNTTVYCVKSDTETDKSILGDAKIRYMINGENYCIYQDNEDTSKLIIEPLDSGYYTEDNSTANAVISDIDWTKLNLDKVENDENEEIVAATDIKGGIDSVEIKNGIKELGDELFRGFFKLSEVILPDTLTTIGVQVFDGDSSLREITIPDSVTGIGKYTFRNCTNLSTITLSKNLTELSDGLFMNSALEEIRYSDSDTKNVLSSNIKKIGDQAFEDTKLEYIYIPDGVETIGERAFADSENLTTVVIASSITEIGEDAFDGCSKDLVIKCEKESYAEEYAEENNIKVENIKLPDSIKLSDSNIQLDLNGTYEKKITYTILPTNADTDLDVTWSSSDESVAVVNNDGNVEAIGIGKCVITATTKNGKSATCNVTVIKSTIPIDEDKKPEDNGPGYDEPEDNDSTNPSDLDNNNGYSGFENGVEDEDLSSELNSSNPAETEENYGDSTSGKEIPYTGYEIALGLGIIIAGIVSILSYIKFKRMDI